MLLGEYVIIKYADRRQNALGVVQMSVRQDYSVSIKFLNIYNIYFEIPYTDTSIIYF